MRFWAALFRGGTTPVAHWVPNCSCGVFYLEVVGESHYQDELRQLRKEAGVEGTTCVEVRPQPENLHDGDAVLVQSHRGRPVGHIARELSWYLRPFVERFSEMRGTYPRCRGRLAGGDLGRASIGIWLDLDYARLGLPRDWRRRALDDQDPGEALAIVRTGLTRLVQFDEIDDAYDLSWMEQLPADPLARIRELKTHLLGNKELVSRHFIYCKLEEQLYRSRDQFASALIEYDLVCEEHDREMDAILPELVARLGVVPLLETYRQQAIRQERAKEFERARWWALRGIRLYGEDAGSEAWVQDLEKRVVKLNRKVGL